MSADRAITEAERDVLKLARRFAKSWAEGDKDPRGNALDLDLLSDLCDAVDALPEGEGWLPAHQRPGFEP